MKILSLNCRGLVNSEKKSSLKILVVVIVPDVIFLQETMGVSELVVASLKSIFPGWSFAVVDAKGRSRGLATRWCLKHCNCE
jgi:exonuclease III